MSINVEEILDDLYASEINVEISWLWYGGIGGRLRRRGIDVRLGDPLHGYAAIGKASRMADAAVWLRDQACQRYPDSEFSRKHCGFVWGEPPVDADAGSSRSSLSKPP